MNNSSDNKYYVYTIDGDALMYHYDVIKEVDSTRDKESRLYYIYGDSYWTIHYSIDTRDLASAQHLIKSYEKKDDTALFHQIRHCINKDSVKESAEQSLIKQIIYIDFDTTFRNIKGDIITKLSIRGQYITNLTEYEQQKELEATASENDDAEAEPETDISEYYDDYDDYDYDDYDYDDYDYDDYDYDTIDDYYLSLDRTDYLPHSTKITNSDRLRILFARGIDIIYEDGTTKTFVPFDKSQSMARTGRICFINKEIIEDITKRLTLDIEFSEIPLVLSKYYAYRGLYLSSATRITSKKLVLNSSTVVVLKDSSYTGLANTIYASDNNTGVYTLDHNPNEAVDKTETKISDIFDGEGLISPEYSEYINETYASKRIEQLKATSFQIRMPFTKGMLHEVDFHGFLREYAPDSIQTIDNKEVYNVTDCFGIKRNLFEAQIILTESMFKAKKWLSRWVDYAFHLSEENGYYNRYKISSDDPMKFYFEKFQKYDHALYISGTDIPYFNRKLIKLNYQFLNTLKLSKDDYKQLINNHLSYTKDISSYFKNISVEINDDENNDSLSDQTTDNNRYNNTENNASNNITVYRTSNWRNALIANPDFSRDVYVKKMIDSTIVILKFDIGFGHILSSGEIRFLSRDLLYFLTEILELQENEKETVWANSPYLDDNHFYMPNNNIDISNEQYYPILRSPHLSRNEQCALKAYIAPEDKNNVRTKYFGHLKGVLMVSYSSFAPSTLGGADFDEDTVKIYQNDIIRDAVLKGAYDMKDDEVYDATKAYDRVLPIISIPSKTGHERSPQYKTIYKIILDTFSNNIGRISNLAIQIGQHEYYPEHQKKKKPENQENKNSEDFQESTHYCAECTILTGLEIDACKTGFHPNLDTIFKDVKSRDSEDSYNSDSEDSYNSDSEDSYNYISDFKIPFEKYTKKKYFDKNKEVEIFNNTFDLPNNDELYGLNLLPHYFYKYCIASKDSKDAKEKNEKKSQVRRKKLILFDFENKSNWSKDLDTEALDKMTNIIKCQKKINRLIREVNQTRNNLSNTNWQGYIYTILDKQYDSYREKIIDSGNYNALFSFIRTKLNDSYSNLEDAINRLYASDWPYLPNDKEKTKEFARILNLESISDKDIKDYHLELLLNFNQRGFLLLYLVLMECKKYFVEDYASIIETTKNTLAKSSSADADTDTDTVTENAIVPANDSCLHEFWNSLYEIYYDNKVKKKTDNEISSILSSECMNKMSKALFKNVIYKDLLEEDKDLLFKYVYKASKEADYEDFFWQQYKFDYMKKFLYIKPEESVE